MIEKIIFYVISFMGGIVFWSLRALIVEKTMKRRATDQYVSLGELDVYCRRKHDTDNIIKELELKHLKELLEKDLNANTKRLEKLEKAIGGQVDILTEISEWLRHAKVKTR